MPRYIVLVGWLVDASDGDTARRVGQMQVGICAWSQRHDVAMAVSEANPTDDVENDVLPYVLLGAAGYRDSTGD